MASPALVIARQNAPTHLISFYTGAPAGAAQLKPGVKRSRNSGFARKKMDKALTGGGGKYPYGQPNLTSLCMTDGGHPSMNQFSA